MQNKVWGIVIDDLRDCEEIYSYTKNPIYIEKKWKIVRNYSEFVSLLGLIKAEGGTVGSISFDFDLCPEHYQVPFEIWRDYTADQLGLPENGLDCLNYMIDFVDENKHPIPGMEFHTMNPVGKELMKKLAMDWLDSWGGDEEVEGMDEFAIKDELDAE